MVNVQFVSLQFADPIDIDLDPEMTVAEARVILQEISGCSANDFALNVRGSTVLDDRTWGSLNVVEGERVFVVSTQHRRSDDLNTAQEHREAPCGFASPSAMEPMVSAFAENPAFIEFLVSMNPELQSLCQRHPEIRQALSNPSIMRDLIRTAVDPNARSQMVRENDLRLAQISNVPGGTAMLEQYLGDVLTGESSSNARVRDTHDASVMNSMPQSGKACNSEPLPNPWSQQRAPSTFPVAAQPSQPAPAYPAQHVPPSPPNMYVTEMSVLRDMGFTDEVLMLQALRYARGDIGSAVAYIDEHISGKQ